LASANREIFGSRAALMISGMNGFALVTHTVALARLGLCIQLVKGTPVVTAVVSA
jgi:hypothetical protein